jgi:FtsH-binding integral membrane protein
VPKAAAVSADFGCVLLFVAIGRANHHDGGGLAGLWGTLWPFAAGLAIGLLATRFWRRPTALLPTGVGVWLSTVAAGMILRVLAGQGTAFTFVLVALGFLGLSLLGWRVAWQRLGPALRRLTADAHVRNH